MLDAQVAARSSPHDQNLNVAGAANDVYADIVAVSDERQVHGRAGHVEAVNAQLWDEWRQARTSQRHA